MTAMKPISFNNASQVQVYPASSSPSRFGKQISGGVSGLLVDALSNLFPPQTLFQQQVVRVGDTEIRFLTPTDPADKRGESTTGKGKLNLLA